MIKIIETNLSIFTHQDGCEIIKDHQSRVIEVESWEDYIEEIKQSKSVVRNSIIGSLHGVTILPEARVENLTYDDFHLNCDVINRFGIMSKKLAFRL